MSVIYNYMNCPTGVVVFLTECQNYEILINKNRLWNVCESIYLIYFVDNMYIIIMIILVIPIWKIENGHT